MLIRFGSDKINCELRELPSKSNKAGNNIAFRMKSNGSDSGFRGIMKVEMLNKLGS
jgi:hypothetical protein